MINAAKKTTKTIGKSKQYYELTPEIIRENMEKTARSKASALAYLKSIGCEIKNGKIKVTPL